MPLDQVFNEPLENVVNFFSTMELKKVSFRLLTKSVWELSHFATVSKVYIVKQVLLDKQVNRKKQR